MKSALQVIFNEFEYTNLKYHYEANLKNPHLRPDFSLTFSSIAGPSWQDCISFIECKSTDIPASTGGQAITYLVNLLKLESSAKFSFSALTNGLTIQFFIIVKDGVEIKSYYTSNLKFITSETEVSKGFELLCRLMCHLSGSGISADRVLINGNLYTITKTFQKCDAMIIGVVNFEDEEGQCVVKCAINRNKPTMFSIRKEALMYDLFKDSPVRTLKLSKRSNSNNLVFRDVCDADLRSWAYELLMGADASDAIQKVILCYIEIFDQIKAIHDLGYTHSDIRPANVLVLDDGLPYLIDFVTVTRHDEVLTWMQGTLVYMANELLLLEPPYCFKKKFDMESFCYLMLDCADRHFVNSFLKPRAEDIFESGSLEKFFYSIRQKRIEELRLAAADWDHFPHQIFIKLFFKFFDKLGEVENDLTDQNYIELREILSSFTVPGEK